MSGMFTCKLTGKNGRPVKAHVIPKAFYEIPPQSEGPYKLVSGAAGVHPKKVPIGIYDNTMVTKDGEDLFGPWDDLSERCCLGVPGRTWPVIRKSSIISSA